MKTVPASTDNQAYLLLPLSWDGLSGHFWLSGLITIAAIARQASSILVADDRFKLRCSAEYLQIPLTQQTMVTTVTEGTETLPETKKIDVYYYMWLYTPHITWNNVRDLTIN